MKVEFHGEVEVWRALIKQLDAYKAQHLHPLSFPTVGTNSPDDLEFFENTCAAIRDGVPDLLRIDVAVVYALEGLARTAAQAGIACRHGSSGSSLTAGTKLLLGQEPSSCVNL